ncbi:YitT family protein [Mobilibacterium timonense]
MIKWFNDLDPNSSTTMREVFYIIVGNFISAAAINYIVYSHGFYMGGFAGISMLLNLFFRNVIPVPIPASVNLVGILYFILNAPLFIWALRVMGVPFTVKTLISVGLQSVFLAMVPVPATPPFTDPLTTCIVGGILGGFGNGLVLRARCSCGGQDIIGVVMSRTHPNFTVGKISIFINIGVFSACFLIFNAQMVVYSFIFVTIYSLTVDRIHTQNIRTTVMIFTKKEGIAKAIMSELPRGVTDWVGEGAYTNEKTYILVTVVSKYEMTRLREIVNEIDPDVFMIATEGNQIYGNFQKRLS